MTTTPELLRQFWALDGVVVEPLGGGMNSETWMVEHEGSTYVAKRVPPGQVAELVTGCQIARALAAAGVVTGRPVPAADGRLVLTEHGLALLEHVPGRSWTATPTRSRTGSPAPWRVCTWPALPPPGPAPQPS